VELSHKSKRIGGTVGRAGRFARIDFKINIQRPRKQIRARPFQLIEHMILGVYPVSSPPTRCN
jgi:hypothetical protein